MNLCPIRTMVFIVVSLAIAIVALLAIVLIHADKFHYRIAIFVALVYLAGMVVCWINCFGGVP